MERTVASRARDGGTAQFSKQQDRKGIEAMANAIKLARKEATTLLFFGLLVVITFCV